MLLLCYLRFLLFQLLHASNMYYNTPDPLPCRDRPGDITPPVGIYHRMWGAATHDRATGVHKPLLATLLWLEPAERR